MITPNKASNSLVTVNCSGVDMGTQTDNVLKHSLNESHERDRQRLVFFIQCVFIDFIDCYKTYLSILHCYKTCKISLDIEAILNTRYVLPFFYVRQ